MGDLVRHTAEQEALRAGHALVADHDQVGALLLGDVEDRVSRTQYQYTLQSADGQALRTDPVTEVRLSRRYLLA